MFTPDFWETENKIGNALYRINQSQYKDYCEIDELFVFLAQEYPEERELFETAVRLNDRDKRQQLFNTAQAAAEWFSLEDWITGTQEESGHRGA